MNKELNWTKEIYEKSISSRCWACTPYDKGWEHCPELRKDKKLQELVELEQSITPISGWAIEAVERAINFPPFCPHYAFPQPYIEVLDTIRKQTPPVFIHGCYTASAERKNRMSDYVFCLDKWLAGVSHEKAAAELCKHGNPKVDWNCVCENIWKILGKNTELKELLVERTLHRQRWWIKSLVWEDDARDVYYQDQYLGDIACDGDHYGNPAFRDPYLTELEVPEVKRMESRLAEICPDWEWFRSIIYESWLCTPKAFRFLERLIWCIGKEKKSVALPSYPMENPDKVPRFLQCDDTYPYTAEASKWVASFVEGIRSWVQNNPAEGKVENDVHLRLGEQTPLKLWLTELYLRKIELINPYGVVSLGKTNE